jgi:hypothetical protein
MPGDKFEIPGSDTYPERVVVDLESKDPNAYRTVGDDADAEPAGDTVQDDLSGEERELRGQIDSRAERRIARLRLEHQNEQTARQNAERALMGTQQALEAANAEIAQLRTRETSAASALGSSMLAEREAALLVARNKLAAAHEAGIAKDIADATADIAQISADISAIKLRVPRDQQGQQQQQGQQLQGQPPQQQIQQRPPAQQQPVNIAPNVAAWVSHNRSWFNVDKAKTDLAYATHNAIIQRGINPSSPEYTRELDRALKSVYPDHVPFESTGNNGQGRQQAGGRPVRTNVGAEGSREGSISQPRTIIDERNVELTSSQLAIAKRLGISPQAYAKAELQRLRREQQEGGVV